MPHSSPIRILIVDDHSVVRMGLAAVLALEDDLVVVGEAEDGSQAMEKFRAERPDVVLLDVRMPGVGGLEALRLLLQKWPKARIMMLTTSELDDDIHRAIEAGALGYLQKNVSREELVLAIRHVHRGSHYVPEALARRLQQLANRRQLSQREVEVLDGMRRGLSNRDIAIALSISEHTVKAHVKAILQKLESADRAEAVARGFEQGVLRIDDRRY